MAGVDVLIDIQAVHGESAGVPNVAKNLIRSMLKRQDGIRYFVSGRRGEVGKVVGGIPGSGLAEVGEWLDGRSNPAARVVSQHLFDSAKVNRICPRIYFAPASLLPFGISGKTAKIALIHDLAPFRVAKIYTRARAAYHRWLLRSVAKRADHLVAVSAATKADLMELFRVPESDISVIPNAVDCGAYRGGREEIESNRLRLGLPKRYALFVGKVQPRKNIARLIEAFGGIAGNPSCDGVELVIVGGKGWMYGDILGAYEASPAKDRIRFTGHVQDEDLPWYYRCAEVFAYPSLYEGFGLPLLEAMANGVPVAASRDGAIGEVAGGAGAAFDPYDVDSISKALVSILGDAGERKRLIELGYARAALFNWDASAARYVELWKRFT